MTGGGSPDHTPLILMSYEDPPRIQRPRGDRDDTHAPPKTSQSPNVTRKKKQRTSKVEPPVDYPNVAEAAFFRTPWLCSLALLKIRRLEFSKMSREPA